MGGSFELVKGMSLFLVTRRGTALLVVWTLIPLAPLLLTVMPLEALIDKVFGMLL